MTTTRRTPRPAEELIAGWFAGLTAAAGDAPTPADPATPAPTGQESDADQAVDADLDAIEAAIQKAIDDQGQDDNTQPDDAKVMSGLQDLMAQFQKVKAAQAADVGDDADGTPGPAAPAPGEAPVAPPGPSGAAAGTQPLAVPPGGDQPAKPAGGAPAAPVDEPASRPGSDPQGDVDNDTQCLDPECNHLASAHEDTDLGDNTGPCTMANCACKGMRVPDQDPIGDDPAAGAPPEAQGASAQGGQTLAANDGGQAGDPTVVSPGVSGTPADTGNGTVDPANGTDDGGPSLDQPTGPLNGPAFTIPVMIIEGIPTSDGRQVAPEALTWRTPPLPLMGLRETNDFGHDGAVICGRIDSITREGNTITAQGYFDTSADGLEFARLVETQMIKGVSADIADTTTEVIVTDVGQDGFPIGVNEQITAGEIMGATICPFPAFEGAYIVLGDGSDGPSPIPMEKPTPEQAASGLHLLSAEECVPCAEGVPIAASGGPLAPPREWFEDPHLTEPTRLRVDDDGRVYGHFAIDGVCHVGISGQCIQVPMGCDMGPFHQGYVVCADGSEVSTGAITAGIGHADTSGRMSNAAVMAHYDNALYGVADVVAGEDEFGQWVAGALRPTATEEQIHTLRASSLSGDWRPQGRGYALYATLAVNRPGFPITKATKHNGRLTSVVAAGMIVDPPAPEGPSTEERLANMERAFAAVAPDARANLRRQMESLNL